MKKINLCVLLLGVICLLSCSDDTENKMLKRKISELQEQVVDLQDNVKMLEGELDKCINGDPNKDIQQIGRWIDIRDGDYSATITIFRNIKSNKFYMTYEIDQSKFKARPDEVRVLEYKGLKKYELINNEHNEYFVVEKNGYLSMYGQEGKFNTAKPF